MDVFTPVIYQVADDSAVRHTMLASRVGAAIMDGQRSRCIATADADSRTITDPAEWIT
jgi:hypothetical protein